MVANPPSCPQISDRQQGTKPLYMKNENGEFPRISVYFHLKKLGSRESYSPSFCSLPFARVSFLPTSMPSPQNSWCFTLNHYTDDDISRFIQIFQEKDSSGQNKFSGIFGKEIGAAGNKHLQGLIYGTKKTYKFLWSQLNLKLGHDRTHWEPKKYTMFSAWAYCAKGDQPHEEWEIEGVKGMNWHTNFDGHDTTDFKKQIPRLLGERNIPTKTLDESIQECEEAIGEIKIELVHDENGDVTEVKGAREREELLCRLFALEYLKD